MYSIRKTGLEQVPIAVRDAVHDVSVHREGYESPRGQMDFKRSVYRYTNLQSEYGHVGIKCHALRWYNPVSSTDMSRGDKLPGNTRREADRQRFAIEQGEYESCTHCMAAHAVGRTIYAGV